MACSYLGDMDVNKEVTDLHFGHNEECIKEDSWQSNHSNSTMEDTTKVCSQEGNFQLVKALKKIADPE